MSKKWNIRTKLLIAVLLQLLFLIVMIGGKTYTLYSGEKILLKTAPVDPRSLFSGDYVLLSYDISTIDLRAVETDLDYTAWETDYKNGKYTAINKQLRKVYVKLAKNPGERYWRVVSATRKKPSAGSGEVIVLGREGSYTGWDSEARIRLKYGLESYYITEGTGAAMEEKLRDGNSEAFVEASVDTFGNAGIVAIYLDDGIFR